MILKCYVCSKTKEKGKNILASERQVSHCQRNDLQIWKEYDKNKHCGVELKSKVSVWPHDFFIYTDTEIDTNICADRDVYINSSSCLWVSPNAKDTSVAISSSSTRVRFLNNIIQWRLIRASWRNGGIQGWDLESTKWSSGAHWKNVGSLKLDMVRIFIPWILGNKQTKISELSFFFFFFSF